MKNIKNLYKLKLSIIVLNFVFINYSSLFAPSRTKEIIPSFQNNEILMVAPAESCGGIVISQPTTSIENWDYKNDILELKSWRHFVGDTNTEEKVPLNNPVEWKYDSPEEIRKDPKKLKTLKVMFDSSGTTISDYYSISCAKKRILNGKPQEPIVIDCKGVVNLSDYQESDKYLRCNSIVGPLAGYSFQPFNLNVVQPLETSPLTRGIAPVLKPEVLKQ